MIPEDPIYRGKKGYERFLADSREKTTCARFAEAADEWLENYSRSKPGTLESYQRHVDLHLKPHFGATPLQNITSKDLT